MRMFRSRRGSARSIVTLSVFPGIVGASWVHIGHVDSSALRAVAADAAEAAAVHLDGTEGAHQEAMEAAMGVLATASTSEIGPVMLQNISWQRANALVTTSFPVEPAEANAVRIEVAFVEPTTQQRMAAWLGGAVEHAALAVRWSEGAGAVDCYLPIAVPIEQAGQDELVLGDDVALAGPGQPGAAQLTAQASDCYLGGRLAVGDVVRSVEQADPRVWTALSKASQADQGLRGPAPLVDEDGVVVGFTWAEVDEVRGRKARLKLTRSVTELHGAEGGGPDHGVRWTEIRSAAVPTGHDGSA